MKCISLLAGFTWMDYLSHPHFLNFVNDPGVWGICFWTYGGKGGKTQTSATGSVLKRKICTLDKMFFWDIFPFFVDVIGDFNYVQGDKLWSEQTILLPSFLPLKRTLMEFTMEIFALKHDLHRSSSCLIIVLSENANRVWGEIVLELVCFHVKYRNNLSLLSLTLSFLCCFKLINAERFPDFLRS